VLGGCSQPILGQQAKEPEGSHHKFQELFEKVL
jgi:hypothetical protein